MGTVPGTESPQRTLAIILIKDVPMFHMCQSQCLIHLHTLQDHCFHGAVEKNLNHLTISLCAHFHFYHQCPYNQQRLEAGLVFLSKSSPDHIPGTFNNPSNSLFLMLTSSFF